MSIRQFLISRRALAGGLLVLALLALMRIPMGTEAAAGSDVFEQTAIEAAAPLPVVA